MKKLFLLIFAMFSINVANSQNWIIQNSGTFNDLWSVCFSDSITGYAVGSGGIILKTINGGADWISQTPTTQDLYSVYFIPAKPNTGYAVGGNETILQTTNGGTTWSVKHSGTSTVLYSVYFPDTATGIAVGGSGMVNPGFRNFRLVFVCFLYR